MTSQASLSLHFFCNVNTINNYVLCNWLSVLFFIQLCGEAGWTDAEVRCGAISIATAIALQKQLTLNTFFRSLLPATSSLTVIWSVTSFLFGWIIQVLS